MYRKIFICYLLLIATCVLPHVGWSNAAASQDDNYKKAGSNYGWMSQQGNVRLLIARPNDFGKAVDPESYWLPALAEAFLYFRMGAIPSLDIIPLEDISKELPSHRRFGKRITRDKYFQTAEELDATHVLYWEFEPRSSKESIFHVRVEPLDQSEKVFRLEAKVALDDINSSLNKAITGLIPALGLSIKDVPDQFFAVDILGTNRKNAKRIGECIIQGESADRAALLGVLRECEAVIREDVTMYIAYATAIRFYKKAGNRAMAVTVCENLYKKLWNLYPKLALKLTRFYRTTGKIDKAEEVLSHLEVSGTVSPYAILWERGRIYEAAGNMVSALIIFKQLDGIDKKNPEIHFHLALTLTALGKGGEAERVIKETARLSRKTKGEIYRRLGEEFSHTGNTAFAILAFNKSLRLQVNNPAAWLSLSDLYLTSGNDSAAAVCYLNLYKLDRIKNKGYIKKACALYESTGQSEKARKAYEEAYKRENDPAILIMLAELEYRQKNCKRVRTLLHSLTGAWTGDSRVKDLLEKCLDDKEPPFLTLKGKNPMVLLAEKDPYIEPGAIAVDNIDGDLTSRIRITGTVDVHALDTFTITYTVVDDSENRAEKVRTVIVVDTIPPRITLLGNSPIHQRKGDAYIDPGVTAVDNRDGDISSSVIVDGAVDASKVGNYTLTYTVTDRAGNRVTEKRFVNVYGPTGDFDTTAPVIVAFNEPPTVITVGDSYLMPQVKAFDDRDGDITSHLTAWGRVDTSFAGKYAITFSAADRSGNVGKKTFEVTVKDARALQKTAGKKISVDTTADKAAKDKKALVEMEPDWDKDVLTSERPKEKKSEKQKKDKDRERKVSNRKVALSITTGVLGVGFGVYGLVMNTRIPERQAAYNASDQCDVDLKRSELERTGLLRNIGYIGAGVFGLGFTINIAIPDRKKEKMAAIE